jgi:ribosome biogenesis protein UTP30
MVDLEVFFSFFFFLFLFQPDEMDSLQIEKATKVLLKWNSKQEKNDLLESKEYFYLIVTLQEMPKKVQLNPTLLHLKHPIHSDSTICIFTKDPQSDYEDLPYKTMGIKELKEKKAYEEKRQLSGDYELFLADKRVLPLLPKKLGKSFFNKKKQPVGLDMKKSKELIQRDIETILNGTLLYQNVGTCLNIKVGLSTMTQNEIVENIEFVHQQLNELKLTKNKIQSIHVKLLNSTSLPLLQLLPQ